MNRAQSDQVKRLGIIVLLTFVTILCYAAPGEQFSTGLLFGNRYHPPATSLDLTPDGNVHLEERFSLSFEFAIWDDANFGYVFWVEGVSGKAIILSYANYEHPDTSFLILYSGGDEAVFRMPMAMSNLGKGKWHTISLEFDLAADRIEARLDDEVYRGTVSLVNSTDISLSFGFRNEAASVPRMAVRHIRLSSRKQGEPDYHWPLNEYGGELAHDAAGDQHGIQNGGEWLAGRHTNWWPVAEMKRPRDSEVEVTLIDPLRQKVLFVSTERVLEQAWDETSVEVIPFADRFPLHKPQFEYDAVSGKLFAFHGGRGQVSLFDRGARTWSQIDTSRNSEDYYRIAPYYDVAKGELFLFGGYGRFTAKNHIQKYDFDKGQWNILHVTGDEMEPRSFVIPTAGFAEDKIFFAGGYGSKSGRQEAGFRHFQDLWQFDTENQVLTKIADFRDVIPEMEIHGLLTMPEQRLYLMGSIQADTGICTQLYEVDAELNGLSPVGESIPFEPSGLYSDAAGKKIIVPVCGSSGVADSVTFTILAIDFPPVPPHAEPLRAGVRSVPSLWPFLIILATSTAIGYGLWSVRGNGRWKRTVKRRAAELRSQIDEGPFSVRVFGDYRVVVKGELITHRMWSSQKARLLLLYLILRDSRGVPAEQAIADFWPDADHNHGMNSLNVSVSTIRHVLKNFDGDIVLRADHLIRLSQTMIESSDLFRFRQLSADGVLPEDLERALKIYGEGGLAPEVEAPWIGPVREHTHREAQRTACRLSEAYDEEADWKKMELLGQQVLSWDDLDDDGIRMVVKGLYKSRKISLAREEYLKFAERYRREIEEEYEIQFDGLVE